MDILNIDGLRVLDVQEKDNDYCITVETTSPPSFCPHCGEVNPILQKFGTKDQLFMDLPIHAKRVGVLVKRQRYRCKSCGSTFLEELTMMDAKHTATTRLINYVGKQSLQRTFISISEDIGVDEKTIRNIFHEYVEHLQLTIKFETPRWMGIDELHIINKPRGVITNIKEKTIVDLLENRNKDTITRYLMKLPSKDQIELVAMDMWQPYKDAVQNCLPQAVIVIDKFHVTSMANIAMENARKQLRLSLQPKERRALMHDRFILLKRRNQITGMQTMLLEAWLNDYPVLKDAYLLKEQFFGIWDYTSRYEAMAAYEEWVALVEVSSVKNVFKPTITAMTNWQTEIFNYFDCRITNAYTESLNSLIRSVNRMGRGYSFEALRAKMLYSEGLHKKRTPKYAKQEFIGRVMESFNYQSIQGKNLGINISTLIALIDQGDF